MAAFRFMSTPTPQSEIRQRRIAELRAELAQLTGGQAVGAEIGLPQAWAQPVPAALATIPPPTDNKLNTDELMGHIRAALVVVGTLGLVKPGILQALLDPEMVQFLSGALIIGARVWASWKLRRQAKFTNASIHEALVTDPMQPGAPVTVEAVKQITAAKLEAAKKEGVV